MLEDLSSGALTDWNGTVAERVQHYLDMAPEQRGTCYLRSKRPVVFRDDLPPHDYLGPDKIEMLAERLASLGKLVPKLAQDMPSRLFRLTGFPGQLAQHGTPTDGRLRDLVQIAINDSDDLWRYSIVTQGRPLIASKDIQALADEWGIRPE